MATEFLLTSESVGEGHPDKVADRISDAVLDAYLTKDPNARVACETLVTKNYVCIAGEVRTTNGTEVDQAEIERIARAAIADIGYVDNDDRFCADHVAIDVKLHRQSGEIADAVDKTLLKRQGAGDQGMMFGYATDETPVLMPAPITWAHALTRTLAKYRRDGTARWLRPDSKSQVSVRYVDGRPVEITRIVVSTQHERDVAMETIRDLVIDQLIPTEIQGIPISTAPDAILVNPSGSFIEGGPAADTGLTGRKIIVDTYGGAARHGGGAFSGKDPSKVDRSAAYAARWAAKSVVAAGLARRCEICVAYAIGYPEPVAIGVETFGTARDGDEPAVREWVLRTFDLTPSGLIETLDLKRPIYTSTSAYGHFGRANEGDGLFPWENAVRESAAVGILV